MRFHFALTPLDQVRPWASEYWPHWFGLSDGTYWIELFGEKLLCENDVPYMDYYVARFWEDLLDATHDLLAGVPHNFNLGYIRGAPSLRLHRIHNRVKIWWREDGTDVVTAVPLKEFLAALAEFDQEVMAAMVERLGDDPRLLAEHADRSRWLGRIVGGQSRAQCSR
ncbi:DUF5984 family protein [Kutzneria buriramensis]|uniref:Uncharacterized protein n=1 Tax=Kutzneria buriramensis TaxID=1045776 RepID=A0A3E0I062_9PSEU|nr:DUF5984 family protein [Kutzneria buriramensis]REH51595.1 hypothetical protein BCF44_10344 [Kutzneria buriramensis]